MKTENLRKTIHLLFFEKNYIFIIFLEKLYIYYFLKKQGKFDFFFNENVKKFKIVFLACETLFFTK